MIKQLEGKWYGQRQALGDTFSIAASKILADENSGRIKNEYANLTFRDGILFLAFKDNDQKIVDSAKYSLSEDSILTSGHYKTKVIKLTNDSLLLYSKDEKILKSLRIFTRQK
ncbi:hypothetical protein ACFE6N_01495 [Pedobacter sp. BG31]|uniref:hypothetical protein n=1 Tax=Pedobacter sp. BG31 TaxID=3349697 RepID=UPI0035F245DC